MNENNETKEAYISDIDVNDIKKSISVLCVEDETIIMDSLELVLKRRFDKIYTASNGKEGLDIFKNNPVDIVITDILMPVMDGVEMTHQIKEIRQDTPIIVLSAFNEEPFLKKMNDLGIYGYITKPFNRKDLFNTINIVATDVYKQKNAIIDS
ncbi:MAG: response regulator [Nitrospirae bacterium]|nr:response regulator [Nitrospirota bacterium]